MGIDGHGPMRKFGLECMKLETLVRSMVGKTVVLVAIAMPLLQLIFPHVSVAQAADLKANQTFQIKIENDKLAKFIDTVNISTTELKGGTVSTVESQIPVDPCAERREKLYKYFTEVRPSRFANHVDTLACQEHWRKVTAIAFVESTLGKYCYYNNCWGITYSSGLAKFKTLDEGIVTHNNLIAKRYAKKTYQQMNCVYVVPCNRAWVNGALQIEAELDRYVEPRS